MSCKSLHYSNFPIVAADVATSVTCASIHLEWASIINKKESSHCLVMSQHKQCVLDSIGCSGIPRGDGVQNLWGGWDDWQVPEVFTKCSLSLSVFGQYTYLQASDFILVISQQFNIHYRVIASLPVNTTSCSYIITRIKGSMQLGTKWISVTLNWKCT